MKLLGAGDVGPLFDNPKLWPPTDGRWLHKLIAVALPFMLLLGSASTLASGAVGTRTPECYTEAGLASKLLQKGLKVLGRRNS